MANNYKISEDIYNESLQLNEDSYKISDDIYEEVNSLTLENVRQLIIDSYKLSGRYWIWRMGSYCYQHDWDRMLQAGEMQVEALGFKYLKSYLTLSALQLEYERIHPDKVGSTTLPPAYWAFTNYLRKGDVVFASIGTTNIFAWGIVESSYKFKPVRQYGRHYRRVSWHKIDMPFIFTSKKPALFQIASEETNHLKETLINKIDLSAKSLPFGFDKKLIL